MIIVDDMNDWVGCLGGHPQVKTPHIDRLAKRGLLFTNAHVAAPVCNPSRVATLTGRSYRVKDSQPPTPEPKKAKKSNEPSTAGAAS